MTVVESISVKGDKQVAARLKGLGKRGTLALLRAIRSTVEQIATESLSEVPRQTGRLANSQKVYVDEFYKSGTVLFDAPYALAVHEIPPPPQTSESGRSANHDPPTKWKYLEDPFKRAASTYRQTVLEELEDELR